MPMHKILILLFSILGTVAAFNTQAQVDTNAQKIAIDSSILHKKMFTFKRPKHYYIGVDVVKLGYNIIDKSKTRFEAFVEAPMKNNNWLMGSVSFANSKIDNTVISYNTKSIGGTLGIAKSLFTPMHSKDIDNAFIGVSYGFAQNRISTIDYSITDVWGTNSGIISGKNVFAHWLELNAGFRFEIKKNIVLSWRIAGKTLINQKALQAIAPLYIAPYGNGDKVGTFGFNFLLLYKLK
jgi:Domain of unknown function (DUF6048)